MNRSFNRAALLEQISLDDDQFEDDPQIAFELIRGRLTLRGQTWELPVHPHWSADPFEDPEWRAEYQSLAWLAPLRRRALEGDDDARQAWWWLCSTWLESLKKLEPGEGTPWRPEIAAIRSTELVAGLVVAGRQPWILESLYTHLSWFDSREDIASRPLVLMARFAMHHALHRIYPADGLEQSLNDWHERHFTTAGAPRVAAHETVSVAIKTLRQIETGLEQCGIPTPWVRHNHRLSELHELSAVCEPNNHPVQPRLSLVETEQAKYAVVGRCGVTESFVGMEITEPPNEVDLHYAIGGQVWLSTHLSLDNSRDSPNSSLSIRIGEKVAALRCIAEYPHSESDGLRVFYSIDAGIALLTDTKSVNNLSHNWHESWTFPPDADVRKTGNSMRLDRGSRTVFVLKIQAGQGYATDSRTNENVATYWYMGPWNSRMIDILQQPGTDPFRWSEDTFLALVGKTNTDGDLKPLFESEVWKLNGSRQVLKIEFSSDSSPGFLSLTDPQGRTSVRSGGSGKNWVYLSLIDLPDGAYQLVWQPHVGEVRNGPTIAITDRSLTVTE